MAIGPERIALNRSIAPELGLAELCELAERAERAGITSVEALQESVGSLRACG